MSRIAFPRGAAQPVERRPCAARVLLNQIEPLDGDEQLGVVLIPQLEELLRAIAAAHAELFQADEFADPVIHVNDEIAYLEIAEIGQERFGDTGAPVARPAFLVEDVALDVDRQCRVGQPESAGQRAHRHQHRGRVRVLRTLHRHGHHVVVAQDFHRAFGAPGAGGDEQHGVAALARLAKIGNPVADAAVEFH